MDELAAVHGVLHDHAVGDDAEALGLVEQAQVFQDPGAVRGDLHAGPDLAELALALVQLDREALLGEGGGRGEAADAAPMMSTSARLPDVNAWTTVPSRRALTSIVSLD